MFKPLKKFLLLCMVSAAIAAHADPIVTGSISAIASGTFGNQSFTNQTVTFYTTFDLLPEWSPAAYDPTEVYPYTTGDYVIDSASLYNVQASLGVSGIGIYPIVDNYIVVFDFTDPSNLSTLQLESISDSPFDLGLSVGTIDDDLGDSCLWSFCPLAAETDAGTLTLTTQLTPGVATVEVSGLQTPEPDTLVLTATGLLGFAGLIRRRLTS